MSWCEPFLEASSGVAVAFCVSETESRFRAPDTVSAAGKSGSSSSFTSPNALTTTRTPASRRRALSNPKPCRLPPSRNTHAETNAREPPWTVKTRGAPPREPIWPNVSFRHRANGVARTATRRADAAARAVTPCCAKRANRNVRAGLADIPPSHEETRVRPRNEGRPAGRDLAGRSPRFSVILFFISVTFFLAMNENVTTKLRLLFACTGTRPGARHATTDQA